MEAEIQVESRNAPAPGWGGARPGAGRKPGQQGPVETWKSVEDRIRGVARRLVTKRQLRALFKADPWRFIERIMLPLMSLEHRSDLAGMRVGLKFGDGVGASQFVLDFGADPELERREAEAREALESFVARGESDRNPV